MKALVEPMLALVTATMSDDQVKALAQIQIDHVKKLHGWSGE